MAEDVTRVMMDEHQLILRMITLVEKNTALLEQRRFRNWQFYLDAVDFIRNYADRFHHAKEEDVLFVELIKNGMPEKNSPIEAMLMEHDQGRGHVRGMEEAAQKALEGETGQAPAIIEHARAGVVRDPETARQLASFWDPAAHGCAPGPTDPEPQKEDVDP